MKRVRVVILSCEGFFQRALAARLAQEHLIVGMVKVVQSKNIGNYRQRVRRLAKPFRIAQHLVGRGVMSYEEHRARSLAEILFPGELRVDPVTSGVPILRVNDVNAPEVPVFLSRLIPDVVCVNGTNLLRAPVLDLVKDVPLGIVNLHTGLSPYSRGGNCNLFMLIEGHPEYVGVTVHHVDPGIDSGDIIFTGRPEFQEQDTFETIELKSWRRGIDLMANAVGRLSDGTAQRVPQWEEGKLFLRRTGYTYDPSLRLTVARRLRSGLVREYLTHRETVDRDVRIVE